MIGLFTTAVMSFSSLEGKPATMVIRKTGGILEKESTGSSDAVFMCGRVEHVKINLCIIGPQGE